MKARSERPLLELVDILQRAHAGELGAYLAYRGHARSLADRSEASEVLAIAGEEVDHRERVGRMLADLGKRPRPFREALFYGIGFLLGGLCRFTGWLAPMYGAGRLERGNIQEYERAAGLAIVAGRSDFAPDLLRMAEAEWEHERYFRAKVLSRVSFLPLWTAPPPRESIGPTLPRSLTRRPRARSSHLESDPSALLPASWRGTAR